MIAVDTSALMAVLLNDRQADACVAALAPDDNLLISAGTIAESLIVAAWRNLAREMEQLIDELGFEVITVTPAAARRIAQSISDGVRACILPA